jgi:GTP-binding protein
VLVHLVDVSSASGRDPVEDLDTVRRELELFQPALAAKPQIVAANKMDAVDDASRVEALETRARDLGLPFFRISGVSGDGLQELLEEMWRALARARESAAADIEMPDRLIGETPAAIR